MNKYVLAVGETLADLITDDYCSSLQEARGFKLVQGGSPANVAANINFLGGHAILVSCVGNDGVGKYLIDTIRRSGIDPSHIQIHSTEPTSVVMVTKSSGTPDFIAYRHADTCISSIDSQLIENAQVIHTTAFALSRQPARSSILQALQSGYSHNKTISVDWNFAPGIWGADDGKIVFEEIIRFKPLLKISVDDMERFWKKKLTVEDCKQLLNNYYSKAICITCGKDGIWYKEEGSQWHHEQAVRIEHLVDVTGAGDAFWAGFLTAFLQEEKVPQCIKSGAAAAAQKIQKWGPLYL